MLRLHLKKSRYILDKRTIFLRQILLGEQSRPHGLVLNKRYLLYQNAQKLIHKSTIMHSNKQKITVVSVPPFEQKTAQIPEQTPSVVKLPATKSWSLRMSIFTMLMSLSFAVLVTLFAPIIYFRFFGYEVIPVQSSETGTPLGGEFQTPQLVEKKITLPPREETLPEGNWIVIPRIGVRTEILESEIPEESLIKGVWRVPEYGLPGDQEMPMILAAHRYGYNWWWTGEYWKYNSFYLLPDLEPGDVVEVISDKRKYLYEIYAGEEGTEIGDYDADLILYTCKYLTSDLRHFRYARLIDPSKYPTSTTTAK